MTNSRQKGARGERDLAGTLRKFGHEARRGQQFSGGADSPDVVCPTLPWVHFEVKRTERGNLYNWLEQATSDAGNKVPVVLHRRNRKDWVVILKAEDFFTYVLPMGAANADKRKEKGAEPRLEDGEPGEETGGGSGV